MAATDALQAMWGTLINSPNSIPVTGEWLGWFGPEPGGLPLVVAQAFSGRLLTVDGVAQDWALPFHIDTFAVRPASRCLVKNCGANKDDLRVL